MEKEIFSSGKSVLGIDAEGLTGPGTVYGPWIDTRDYESFVLGAGIIGTEGEVTAIVGQETDASDYSGAVAILDANLLYYPVQLPVAAGTGTSAGIIRVGCVSKKRYIQIGFTVAAANGGVACEILGVAELNNSKIKPANLAASVLSGSQINSPGTEGTIISTPPARTVGQ